MFKFFSNRPVKSPFRTDLHTHIIPGVDDGSPDFEQSLKMIRKLVALGYSKVVATPHIIHDYYPNSQENLSPILEELQQKVKEEGLDIEIALGGEYYLDEHFVESISEKNLLSFGDNYVLLETAFINEPLNLLEAVFELTRNGYKTILAHPERYQYLIDKPDLVDELRSRNVFFQINLVSLLGHYSKGSRLFAEKLIAEDRVEFFGTDCHHLRHLDLVKEIFDSRLMRKVNMGHILNDTL